MFNSLALTTVLLPFVFGLVLALAGRLGGRWSLPLAFVFVSLAYVLLEGMPEFPPVASEQKLPYLFALAALVAVIPRGKLPMPVLVGAFLLGAAGWLGINKFASGGVLASAIVLAPIAAATFGSLALPRGKPLPLLWPSALLCLAIGAALLSALGTFVGFAQVAGSCAALIGAYVLLRYVLLLIGQDAGFAALTTGATTFLLLAVTAVLITIALFAPTISQPAVGILSLTLILPLLIPDFTGQPRALIPVLQGLILALPALGAVFLALTLHQP